MIDDAHTGYEKGGNGHAGHAAEGETPLSDEELAAFADVAADLLPSVEWKGDELKFMYESGKFLTKIGKDDESVDPTETFVVDARSYAELWKRWGEVEGQKGQTYRGVTDTVGGRRIDGWIHPARHLLPEAEPEEWPLGDRGLPKDPWHEYAQITLRRCSDGRLFTWSAQFGSRRGMGDVLDVVGREGRDHPGSS